MKKILLLFLISFQLSSASAQLDYFYYFIESYYTHNNFAGNNIKKCRIYEENIADTSRPKFLAYEQRFDTMGRMCYERRYYAADTTRGITINYSYNSNGNITNIRWIWIEDTTIEITRYIYNSKNLLSKVDDFKKNPGEKNFKKMNGKKLFYDKNGRLKYAQVEGPRSKVTFTHKNDTIFIENKKEEEKYIYLKELPIEKTFRWGIFSYEYNAQLQMIKFTRSDQWRKVYFTKEFTYINGLVTLEVEKSPDGLTHKRRTYEYEKYE